MSNWFFPEHESGLPNCYRSSFSTTKISISQLTDSQECKGDISFATDTWSSPNHYAYMGLTAHFQHQGQLMAIVLDIVEVPKVMLLSPHAFVITHPLASRTQV